MKAWLLLSLVGSFAAYAGSGTSQLEDVRNTPRATVFVTGNAAKLLFDNLSERNMFSIDAAESESGSHTIWKEGANYNCNLSMGTQTKPAKYSCAIPFVSKSNGTVGPAGVAYPGSNGGITKYSGSATASISKFNKKEISLIINGASAERAYNLLSVRVNQYGPEVSVKEEGDNISCSKTAKKNSPVKFSCEINIVNKTSGKITHPGVG